MRVAREGCRCLLRTAQTRGAQQVDAAEILFLSCCKGRSTGINRERAAKPEMCRVSKMLLLLDCFDACELYAAELILAV